MGILSVTKCMRILVSIFGFDVIKEWRNKEIAAALMEYLIKEARNRGRKIWFSEYGYFGFRTRRSIMV